jgi:hypothetical protein
VVRDVRGAADLRLVPGDQHTVLRGHEIGLDVVGAHPRRELVRRERVLRPVAGRAAVADDREVVVGGRHGRGAVGHRRCSAHQGQRGRRRDGHAQ